MNQNQALKEKRFDHAWAGSHYTGYSASHANPVFSAEKIGAERGYVQGIEDERLRSREKILRIVHRLKLRGYPAEHIAEDTGISLEEVSSL